MGPSILFIEHILSPYFQGESITSGNVFWSDHKPTKANSKSVMIVWKRDLHGCNRSLDGTFGRNPSGQNPPNQISIFTKSVMSRKVSERNMWPAKKRQCLAELLISSNVDDIDFIARFIQSNQVADSHAAVGYKWDWSQSKPRQFIMTERLTAELCARYVTIFSIPAREVFRLHALSWFTLKSSTFRSIINSLWSAMVVNK